jgi:PadR family transcriptional regulator
LFPGQIRVISDFDYPSKQTNHLEAISIQLVVLLFPHLTFKSCRAIISLIDISINDIGVGMKINPQESHAPLSEPTLYILLSLASGPKHGYAIAKDVKVLSEARVTLSVSTLYTVLKRLLEDGWIERAGEVAGLEGREERRKAYALTGQGQRILAAERQRLTALLALVRKQTAGESL